MRATFQDRTYDFPQEALGGTTSAPLLKPADELLLNWFEGREARENVAIYHDHFGVLRTVLAAAPGVVSVSDNYQHHRRLREALARNGASAAGLTDYFPTYPAPASAPLCALMHLPKYLDLFEFYLADLARVAGPDFELAVAFQTRHFTPRILEIAGRYARKTEQSRAYKKARTLVLSDWQEPGEGVLAYRESAFRGKTYEQLYGVFSAGHIDYATQFLLEAWGNEDQLRSLPEPAKILDIGTGNGVILDQLHRDFYPAAQLCGTDVSHVAIRSAKRNISAPADLRWQADLDGFTTGDFDLVVTNPPFHEGHRNTIGPTLQLFREAAKALKFGGYFVVVANRHLNYATHLERIFGDVREVATNEKFVIYRCRAVN